MRGIISSFISPSYAAVAITFTLFILVACDATLQPPKNVTADRKGWPKPDLPDVRLYGALADPGGWNASAQDLIAETVRVGSSARFANVLTAQKDLHVSGKLFGDVDGWVALASYWGIANTRRMIPPFVTLAGGDVGDDVPGITALCSQFRYAQIRLQPYVLNQWRYGNPEQKSCAVNTLAHELSHTVIEDGGQVFRDGWLHHSLASYAIGAIAQCVYLEDPHAPRTAKEMQACLEQWGTAGSTGCTHDVSGPESPLLRNRGSDACVVQP